MKICMILPSLSTGGTERVVMNLSRYLCKKNHEVHLVIFKNIVKFQIDAPLKLHLLAKKNAKSLKALIASLEAKSQPFDYIYSHSLGSLAKKAKLPNRYYVFHNPISVSLEKGFFLTKFLRKLKLKWRYDDENIITVSKGLTEDLLAHGFKPKSIHTIYNPFDFEHIINESKQEDAAIPNEPYIINVARLHHEQKRQDILLKAFAHAKLPCKLLLVGEGSSKETTEIQKLIVELVLEDKVILVGNKPNPFPLIKNAKLLVFSSDFEGFGMVLVEALILNTPIVSTDCKSGPSEIMLDNLSHYLVPIRDIEALSRKMQEAFFNPPKIDPTQLKRFDIKEVAQNYLTLKSRT